VPTTQAKFNEVRSRQSDPRYADKNIKILI